MCGSVTEAKPCADDYRLVSWCMPPAVLIILTAGIAGLYS